MTGDDSPQVTQRIRQYKWHPLTPIVTLLVLFFVAMPPGPTPFWELAPYQQAISLSTLPTMLVSFYWFVKTNGLAEEQTPEERILNDE